MLYMKGDVIMFKTAVALTAIAAAWALPLHGQTAGSDALRGGVNFIGTQVYSDEDNQKILRLYGGLRVADVSDGLDMVDLPGTGLVDPVIHPVWKDLDGLKHQFCGIALTVRYVPTQFKSLPEPGEDFPKWEGNWYTTLSSEAFTGIIRPGTAIVIDEAEEMDVGSIGSNNIMGWYSRGAVGVVTDGSARDTDEVAKQLIPLYLRRTGRGIRPGRNMLESVNRPVNIGGVLVCPGDVVVADGDGVVVVPRGVAEEVALHARRILDGDKAGRKQLYEKLGLPLDQTVK